MTTDTLPTWKISTVMKFLGGPGCSKCTCAASSLGLGEFCTLSRTGGLIFLVDFVGDVLVIARDLPW